jgi:uncharacterized protein YbjT (DUF2867 family)
MGALGYSKASNHPYLKSKALAIEYVKEHVKRSKIVNPSLIFDTESELIREIKRLSFLSSFPNINTKIQPIYRKDVAEIFATLVEGKIQKKELMIGGPEIFTTYEFAKAIINSKGYPCFKIPLFFVYPFMFIAFNKNKLRSIFLSSTTKNRLPKNITLKKFSEWIHEKT